MQLKYCMQRHLQDYTYALRKTCIAPSLDLYQNICEQRCLDFRIRSGVINTNLVVVRSTIIGCE